jgi:hypothetical protein
MSSQRSKGPWPYHRMNSAQSFQPDGALVQPRTCLLCVKVSDHVTRVLGHDDDDHDDDDGRSAATEVPHHHACLLAYAIVCAWPCHSQSLQQTASS